MSNIAKIASHSKWTLASSVIFVIVQAVQILIIVHFISKDSFGYLSISNAFVFLCISLLNSGVVLSIIQSDKITDNDIYQIVKFNIKFAIILVFILLGSSFLLRLIYGFSQIQEIIFYMVPFVLLSSFNAVFIAKMKRALEFKTLSIFEIISVLLSASSVVVLAMAGYEYLSIVLGYLIKVIVMAGLLYFSKKTRLMVVSDKTKLDQGYLDFGKFIYGEKIMTAVLSNADALIIGSLLGMSDLGVYDIFKKIILRPFILFYDAIEGVVFSMISKIKEDQIKFREMYGSFTRSINFLVFPAIAMVYLSSEFLIGFFPISYHNQEHTLQLFSFLIFAIIILNPLDLLLYALGKSKKFFYWMCIYILPFLVVLCFAANESLNVVVIASAGFYVLLFLIAFWFLIVRETPLNFNAYFGPVFIPAFLVLITTIGIECLAHFMELKVLPKFILTLFVFGIFYFTLTRKEKNLKTIFSN